MNKLKIMGRAFGLHPVAALTLLAVDWLLFGGEVATAGVGWLISLPTGILLGLLTVLIQKRAYKDQANVAAAKGFVAGLLTAIPAPLSSMGLLPMAAFGAISLIFRNNSQLTGEEMVESPRAIEPMSVIVR